jgi:SAM-dependent methyltransferase
VSTTYTDGWFARQPVETSYSANVICTLLMGWIEPRSAIDVGCGVGTWLRELKDKGTTTVLGVDGPWVNVEQLQIDEDEFLAVDLEEDLSLKREFDLVLCLELAEHLSPDRADALVKSLVTLGPIVLFSAAIPFQGGLHHANEQWPTYWAERFKSHSYVAIDCIRRRVWDDPEVLVHYRQNTMLFVAHEILDQNPALRNEYHACVKNPMSMVHPDLYMRRIQTYSNPSMIPVRKMVRVLPGQVLRAVLRRLRLRSD